MTEILESIAQHPWAAFFYGLFWIIIADLVVTGIRDIIISFNKKH